MGAGIAGLALAAALTRDDARVTVLEQAHDPSPVGAGVELTPNSLRPLRRLGLGPALDRTAVLPLSRDVLRWHDDHLLDRSPLGEDQADRYGAPTLTLLRSDLHRALREALPAGTVQTGRYVTDLLESSDGVALRCADGRRTHGDLAIGADGANSLMRSLLNTDRYRPARRLIYRGLAPAERVPEVCARARVNVWAGGDRYISCYPVAGGDQVSFTAAVPSGARDPGSWTAQRRIGDLAAAFGGWSPSALGLISAAEWVGVRDVHDHAPIPVWQRGRIALMGDAAHPTLPFFAQSTNQALEDAVALASCLRGADSLTAGPALERYAAARKRRTDRLHAITREILDALRAGGERSPEAWLRVVADAEEANADWIYGTDPADDGLRPVGADPAAG
ncbi:6-hydroxynicotinate 3-monooxygenase precursor [Streptomonospora litoralis]|uniref:6-hydroxynicotinate 3-monooxygenase n=1 Tax=Streptomonospora litoralis TaxID=2498135 RepID=A0A4P6Q371_9ACTN|nr:6-hydroxynicotinate 3-monooxygenase precursor [Streptomonospora litoralis]